MKLKINIIITYDNDEQETFDQIVKVYPRTHIFSHNAENKLRTKFWKQIINNIKGDVSQIVKISGRFYDDDFVMFNGGMYLFKNYLKLWFQPDQRDDFENKLVKFTAIRILELILNLILKDGMKTWRREFLLVFSLIFK